MFINIHKNIIIVYKPVKDIFIVYYKCEHSKKEIYRMSTLKDKTRVFSYFYLLCLLHKFGLVDVF